EMRHSLFHLDRPSVTVVIRTHRIPGADPQYSYLWPGVAFDPFSKPGLLQRQLQSFDTLARLQHPEFESLLTDALGRADPFSFLQLALANRGHLKTMDSVRA